MSSSAISRPSCLKQPSSIAAIAGKYEFEIMSGTASFMSATPVSHAACLAFHCALLALDRRVHGDVAAPFVGPVLAEFEVLALHRHLGLALEFPRPVSEVIAMPWRLRRERRQAEPFPDRLGLLHELALGQRDRRVGALERGVDQHGGAFAAIARAARPMPAILVWYHLEVVLGLAAVGQGPQHRIGVRARETPVDRSEERR